jgi:uncharacterized LabA/DUF88 family protein
VGQDGGMSTPVEGNAQLAVLIDADNADASIVEGLLAEIAKFGVSSVKRIYGDWTTPRLGKWKDTLLGHSIQPIQQFGYTTGKNATDSAMIIDAMDLLYTGTFDGFCIVSSDSDFTRLASRMRESGKVVYGFGERKTPEAFVRACDQFIYTDVFKAQPESGGTPTTRTPSSELKQNAKLVNRVRSAIEAASGENGLASLSAVGNIIVKQEPDFDPRTYGYAKLGDLIEAIGLFTIERKSGGPVMVSNTKPAAQKTAQTTTQKTAKKSSGTQRKASA